MQSGEMIIPALVADWITCLWERFGLRRRLKQHLERQSLRQRLRLKNTVIRLYHSKARKQRHQVEFSAAPAADP